MKRLTTPRLLHVFSTFDQGGPQVRTTALINALGGAFDHTIVAMDGRVGCARLLGPDVSARVVDLPVAKGRLFALRMARWLRQHRPDLLLTYNWGAIEVLAAARAAGLRAVIHGEDGFNADESQGQKTRRVWLRRLLLRGRVVRAPAAVVVPSRNLERIALDTWRVPRARLRHIDNGIDLDWFAPGDQATGRRALGIPDGAFAIGTVAFLRPVKNTAHLLRSFAQAAPRDAHVVVVGDGPDRAALETLAGELGITPRAHFTGLRQDTPAIYRALDVFALSSLSEQMPVAVVEAMACGLPVLATAVGSLLEVVTDWEDGELLSFEPARSLPERVAGRLADWWADPSRMARMGAAGRRHASGRFSPAAFASATEAVYRELPGATAR
jgi:glycosyltransferase involved in cell wall biosynthesis